MSEEIHDRRHDDPRVALLSVGLKALHEDMGEMKATLRELASAVIKLALVEERQAHFLQAQERIFNELEKMNDRLGCLEKARPATERMSLWFERALWAIVAVVAVFVGKKTGLL